MHSFIPIRSGRVTRRHTLPVAGLFGSVLFGRRSSVVVMPPFVDDDGFDDGDARGLVGWLSTRRKWKATVSTNGGGGGGFGADDGARGIGRRRRASSSSSSSSFGTLRKRTDDDDDDAGWFFKNVDARRRRDDDDGATDDDAGEGRRPYIMDGYHYRRVGLDAAERALDAELDAVERALANGGRGLDEAFAFAFASTSTSTKTGRDEGRNDDDDDGNNGLNNASEEPPKMWNARFVGDVLSTTPGRRRRRLDEVEEEREEEEEIEEWTRFSPPPDAGVFAASIPVVSERVVDGETFTSRLDDILDRVDVARALAMEAKRLLLK